MPLYVLTDNCSYAAVQATSRQPMCLWTPNSEPRSYTLLEQYESVHSRVPSVDMLLSRLFKCLSITIEKGKRR